MTESLDNNICGGKVQKRGEHLRWAISEGIKQICQVQRFLCHRCKKRFTLLPHFLITFKRYVVSETEGVLRPLFDGGQLSKAPSGEGESKIQYLRASVKRIPA